MDEDALRACVGRSLRALDVMERSLPLRRGRAMQTSMTIEMMRSCSMHMLLGTPQVDALMDMVRDNTVALQRILGSLADANATMAQLAREQERQRAEHKATHRRLLRHVTESKGWLRVVRRHHPDVPPWPTTDDEGEH